MNWTEAFDNLPIPVKGLIIVFATIVPFWLVAFYLFHPEFYQRGDYIMLGAFCFCFSILWLYLNMLISLFIIRMKKPNLKKIDPNGVTIMAGSIAITHLAICIATTYLFSLWFDVRFGHFLIGVSIYGFFIYIRAYIPFRILREENSEKSNQS